MPSTPQVSQIKSTLDGPQHNHCSSYSPHSGLMPSSTCCWAAWFNFSYERLLRHLQQAIHLLSSFFFHTLYPTATSRWRARRISRGRRRKVRKWRRRRRRIRGRESRRPPRKFRTLRSDFHRASLISSSIAAWVFCCETLHLVYRYLFKKASDVREILAVVHKFCPASFRVFLITSLLICLIDEGILMFY